MVQKPDFYRDVVPVVRIHAKLVFQGLRDADEMVSDAVSVAWEALLTAPQAATPQSVAAIACRRVKSGRQFRQSAKSIGGPNPRRKRKPQREEADIGKVLARERNNPAALATVKMDFTAWLPLLTPTGAAVPGSFHQRRDDGGDCSSLPSFTGPSFANATGAAGTLESLHGKLEPKARMEAGPFFFSRGA
jgi:hypothetical protein